MTRKSRGSNDLLLVALIIYSIVTLSWQITAFVFAFGLLLSLIVFENRDTIHIMFGYIARLITGLRPRQSSSLHVELVRVCASIDAYPAYVNRILDRKKRLFFMLTKDQQDSSVQTYKRLKETERLAQLNYEFLQKIKAYALAEHGISAVELASYPKTSAHDCVDLIEHFSRDWSADASNRNILFERLLGETRGCKRILVPGSGLGRLAVEIAQQSPSALTVDAVEFSASMWLGSKYSVASASKKGTVYPHLMYFSNWRKGEDQFEPIALEFVASAPSLSVQFDDFLKIKPSLPYEAVVTLHFIDTAQNVFEYIDKIYEVLERGGVWCNYGPIKWGTAAYAELSGDEILNYLETHGWKLRKVWDDGMDRYNGSEKSMLYSRYKLLGWVAEKK